METEVQKGVKGTGKNIFVDKHKWTLTIQNSSMLWGIKIYRTKINA